MRNIEDEIAQYLKDNHTGIKNAVPSKDVERHFSISGRTLRKHIHSLRQNGIPICSGTEGYYYAGSQYEINSTAARLGDFIAGILDAKTGLLSAKLFPDEIKLRVVISFEKDA